MSFTLPESKRGEWTTGCFLEFQRKLAPYIGLNWKGRFAGTADLARQAVLHRGTRGAWWKPHSFVRIISLGDLPRSGRGATPPFPSCSQTPYALTR